MVLSTSQVLQIFCIDIEYFLCMERQPPFDVPVVRAALARSISLKGSQDKLATAGGDLDRDFARVRGRAAAPASKIRPQEEGDVRAHLTTP